jgi:hypothetical protein
MAESSSVKKTSVGGARKGSGRKPFTPTDREREKVEAMSGFGVPYRQIAVLVRDGIDEVTLIKYFANELLAGKAKANSKIGQTLYQKAMDGDTTAMIFWAKTQMRWSETARIEHTSPDGSMTPKPAIDVSKLSDSAIAEIIAATNQDK